MDEHSSQTGGEHPQVQRPILLYDGVCAFCNGTVRFVLRRDKAALMRFAPLQGITAEGIFERHPELRDVDSLVLVKNTNSAVESVVVRSDAVFEILRHVGGVWRIVLLLRFIPRGLRNWGYALFAKYRYRVFGRYESCPLPKPEVRARFLP